MPTSKPKSPSGILPVVLVLGCAVGLAFAMTANKAVPEPAPQNVFVPLVEVVELVPRTVRFEVSGQGTVQPGIETQMVAEVSGTIVAVSDAFEAGAAVREGQELVKIDPSIFVTERDEARAVLKQRQLEYDGVARLDAGSFRSKLDLAKAESALASARAVYTRAHNNLTRTRIRMPYDGVVRSRDIAPGQFVSRGTVIGSVFGSKRVEVRLALGQEDLKFVELPQTGQVDTADLRPVRLTGRYRGLDASWMGRIVRTEGVVDPGNRTTFVVVEVLDPYQQGDPALQPVPLPIGTFVSAEIPGRVIHDVLALPRQAIRGNGRLVFVDDQDRLRVEDVPIIRTDAKYAYVRADAVDLRRLVVTTLQTPVNGRRVRVTSVDFRFEEPIIELGLRESQSTLLRIDESLSEHSSADVRGQPQ